MSDQITITLPDGSQKTLDGGATGTDLAASIGKKLAKAALVVVVDGTQRDLSAPLPDGATVRIVTGDSDEGREVLRHSTSHVLAQAVLALYPGAKFAIGPAIEHGFYYDFELPDGQTFTDDDLERIEAKMRQIVGQNQPFVREVFDTAAGLELFAEQPYKREIIERVDASEVTEGEVSTSLSTRSG